MPEMDGVQATYAIKEMIKNHLLNPINIVACTAFGGNEDISSYVFNLFNCIIRMS